MSNSNIMTLYGVWPVGQLTELISYGWRMFPIRETPVTGMFSGPPGGEFLTKHSC